MLGLRVGVERGRESEGILLAHSTQRAAICTGDVCTER